MAEYCKNPRRRVGIFKGLLVAISRRDIVAKLAAVCLFVVPSQ
jgi:hypothetical protein